MDDAPGMAGAVVPFLQRPVTRAIAISTLLLFATAALVVLVDRPFSADRPDHPWVLLVLAIGFPLAERFVFHFEYRRDAISFSVAEMPAALALFFVSPVAAVAVRTVTSVLLIRFARKSPAFKLYFNAALVSFEMALAFTLVRAFTFPDTDDVRLLLVVTAALAFTNFVGPLIVSVVISCFEGDLVARLCQAARTSLVLCPIAAIIAAVGAAPTLVRTELVVFAVVPVIAAWIVVQRFGRLAQSHRDLVAVHGFSALLQSSLRLEEIARVAAHEATRLMRSESATVQVYDAAGTITVEGTEGAPIAGLPTGRNDPNWGEVFSRSEAVSFAVSDDGHIAMGAAGRIDQIAVPIRDRDGEIGLLILAGRAGVSASFDDSDLARAAALADQLASSLRNALLHAQMAHAALHDPLTGEANRLAFEETLDKHLVERRQGFTAVLMMDLNRFKEVNDTLGHHVGDRVLVEFAARIRSRLKANDVIARFGGDVFAVLANRRDADGIRALADRIATDSLTPMTLDELDVLITTSVGIAPFEDDGLNGAEMLRRADIAMHSAKVEHTEIEFYREEIDRRTPERLSLLTALRTALDNGDLEVHYQPKVDLVTSTVIGAEALVRWQHPSRGWIPPCDFVQVAEDSGLIKPLTDFVLDTSIRTARSWQDAGHSLRIAVNLSAHDLLDGRLPLRIEQMLTHHDLSPETLTLEITESALLADTPRTKSTIDRLNALGVKLSLDDFGTGYSSLGYLRRLPVTELKVDQSFVKNVLLDAQDAVIVKSTIDLGHNLGLQVVAEGIENEQVLTRVRDLGCDIAQGYGISRPLAPEQFLTWLATTEYQLSSAPLDASV